jgi:uncharacterized membrane protein (UPF0127 family)
MSKRKVLIVFLSIVLVFAVIISIFYFFNYSSTIVLGGRVFSVEVVDTKAQLEKGLSGHSALSKNEGMFFVFQKPDNYGFWMKDMTFPIDIIWLNQNMQITHIETNVEPKTYPKIFYPNSPSLYALEIKAGETNALHLKSGDKAEFTKNFSKN